MSIKLINLLKILLSIILIYAAALSLRVIVYENNRTRPRNLYTQECAFHYYFTKLAASGQGLPEVDYNIQSPEGFKVRESEPMVMENFAGWMYRTFFKRLDFDLYIAYFVMIFSSLSGIALFFIAEKLFKNNKIAALFSAILYAVSWASVARTTGLVYLKENFALPIIFFQIYFFIRYFESEKIIDLAISAGLMYLALASWHFSRFYFLIISVFAVLNLTSKSKRFQAGFGGLLIAGALASFTVPYLRYSAFIVSYPMCLGYSVIAIWIFFGGKSPAIKALLLFLIFAVILIITLPFSMDMSSYSHVWGLLFYKLKFLGLKPITPSVLPFEVRQLWVRAFHTPDLKSFLSDFLVLFLLSSGAIFYYFNRWKKGLLGNTEKFILYLLAATFIMYLLSARLRSFFVFFIALFGGFLVYIAGKRIVKTFVVVFFVILSGAVYFNTSIKKIVPLASTAMPETVRWIKNNTKKDCTILSTPFCSTEIAAYADRKIALHPKYETKIIRDKISRFSEALFRDNEGDFYNLCKSWNVSYFMFPRGTYLGEGEYSWRYFSDSLSYDPKSIAFKFEAAPRVSKTEFKNNYRISVSLGYEKPELKYFELVYHNRDFNIYKVIF